MYDPMTTVVLLTSVLVFLEMASGLSLNACSSKNIGSGKTSSEFMSNGKCKDTCLSKGYAVAILQRYDCWCSNYMTEDTTSLSNCDTPCPGFGYENCAKDGYYGYLVIGEPSGTKGGSAPSSSADSSSYTSASSSSSSSLWSQSPTSTSLSSSPTSLSSWSSSLSSQSSSSSSSSYMPPTSLSTTSHSLTQTQSSSITSSSSSYSSLLLSASSSSSSTSSSVLSPSSSSSSRHSLVMRPLTVYSVKTVNGNPSATVVVKTDYITMSTLPPSSLASPMNVNSNNDADSNESSSGKSFTDSPGKMAGTFTAVGVVAVALLGGLIFFCIKRRKNQNVFMDTENQDVSSDEYSMHNEKAAGSSVTSNALGTPTTPSRRNSSNKPIFSFFSPSSGNGVARSSSRKHLTKHSRNNLNASNDVASDQFLFPINEMDTRLDPRTMFLTENDSKSLGDEHDYSRKILHVTNPEQ